MFRRKNQNGFILTIELIFMATCLMCVLVAGWGILGTGLVGELADISRAVGSLNQSYSITGVAVGHPNDPTHPTDVAFWAGSSYVDTLDFCDQAGGVRVCIPPTPEGP